MNQTVIALALLAGAVAAFNPCGLRAEDVDWLTLDEPVLAPAIGEAARAYPVQMP